MDEFLSLTELGRLYGVSSHVVGKWLKGLGLRIGDGSPSVQAFNEKYVAQRPSRQPGTYYHVWNAQKTTALLDGMCYPKSAMFLPTHDACGELVKKLTTAGLNAAAHPPLDESTCQKFGTKSNPGPARIALNAGLNVGQCVCTNCDLLKTCEYQKKRELARSADHTVATHARASLSDFQPATDKPIVFVHEDTLPLLRPMAKVVRFAKKQDVPQLCHLHELAMIAKAA